MEYYPLLLEETQHRCFLFYGSRWMRYCLNVTVIAFCVIRKVDYLIVDLHIQTPLPFISEYWYFHIYWYIHQSKWYQKHSEEYSHRNYIESKTDHHIFDEFWQMVKNTGGLFVSNWCFPVTLCPQKATRKSAKIQVLLWVEFCELLPW